MNFSSSPQKQTSAKTLLNWGEERSDIGISPQVMDVLWMCYRFTGINVYVLQAKYGYMSEMFISVMLNVDIWGKCLSV